MTSYGICMCWGGGLAAEGELIEVEELSIAETRLFLQQKEVQAPSGLLFALMWFLTNKAHIYEWSLDAKSYLYSNIYESTRNHTENFQYTLLL